MMIFEKRESRLGTNVCSIEPITMALLGSSAAGLGGSIFSGIFGASGASKQAAAIRYSADKAAEVAREFDAKARADVAPFREYGIQAGNTLSSILSGARSLDDILKESSLFKFQSELGMRGINRELVARGLYGSGAGLETLARFNSQLVGEEGSRIFDRLFNVTTLGANAAARQATNTAAAGQSIAQNELTAGLGIGQARLNQGAALGSIGTGIAGAVQGGIGDYLGYQLNAPLIQSLTNRNAGRMRDPVFDSADSSGFSLTTG